MNAKIKPIAEKAMIQAHKNTIENHIQYLDDLSESIWAIGNVISEDQDFIGCQDGGRLTNRDIAGLSRALKILGDQLSLNSDKLKEIGNGQ